MSNKSSLNNLCRACMVATINLGKKHQISNKSIYDYPTDDREGPTIEEMLQMVTQIKLETEDKLPKIVCLECIQSLQVAHSFIETYREANEKFQKILKEAYISGISDVEKLEIEQSIEYIDENMQEMEALGEEENAACISNYEIEIEKVPIFIEEVAEGEAEVELDEWEDIEMETDGNNKSEDDDESQHIYGTNDTNTDEEWNTADAKSNKRGTKKTSPKSQNEQMRPKRKVRMNRFVDKIQPNKNEDGTILCQQCEAVLEDLKSWREHIRGHRLEHLSKKEKQNRGSTKKSFECEHCGKAFPKISAYNNHIRIHTGEQPFLCMECGKSFRFASSLNTHLLRHRGDKNVQCPHCPKKFVCSSGLYGHMMVHTKNDKPHICDVCGSGFQMAYLLKKHKLYHDGVKNFPCEYCDLRFVTLEKQKRHMRTHTGEKPYRCKYCDKGFAQSNDCNKHLKQHLGENIFQCELCPLRFPLQRELRSHFAMHKDDDEETRKRNLIAREAEENKIKLKLGIK
ncbi:zinc finger protein 555 isoform X1 [Stomoxys calcitrans]|uniref:zinc finger protein 555 isoform X1 n=1 Tax=Stomoxys calcitrans TaxID=35570 RepID=UPI0027E32E77|nr:zinc finger protein 555 isoform X1 [Stomoxys calcitrans]